MNNYWTERLENYINCINPFGFKVHDNEEDNRAELLNLKSKRNVRNMPDDLYNCGGFALETFSWYRPCKQDDFSIDFGSPRMTSNDIEKVTQDCISHMLKDFIGFLRVINDIKELSKDEYAIAFRISGKGGNDFHYCKRLGNGHWYHKRGGCPITKIKKEQVFSETWNGSWFRYTGRIVLFAMKKNK